MDKQKFQELVWDYYRRYKRELPWRQMAVSNFDPYKILVSEVMLQQTQVSRVIPKYQAFLEQFPTVQILAQVPLAAVLNAWSGLGYNRRAKYLHDAAQQLAGKPEPWRLEDLVACKGIGSNTARAVLVYAYNQPLVFIETNIRTVFIHHFFPDRTDVSDKEILPLVEQTLPVKKGKEQSETLALPKPGLSEKNRGPQKMQSILQGDSTVGLSHYRQWYWALMDYGSYLKTTVGNASRASRHYAKQSTFVGSRRQLRGQILRLLQAGSYSRQEFKKHISDERLKTVLDDLLREGLITKHGVRFRLG